MSLMGKMALPYLGLIVIVISIALVIVFLFQGFLVIDVKGIEPVTAFVSSSEGREGISIVDSLAAVSGLSYAHLDLNKGSSLIIKRK